MKAEIIKIRLKSGKWEKELSIDEARELYEELSGIFCDKDRKPIINWTNAPYVPPPATNPLEDHKVWATSNDIKLCY